MRSVRNTIGWGVVVVIVVVAAWLTGAVTAQLMAGQFPTHYADGYCAALGGVALNDEACNVDGKVIPVVGTSPMWSSTTTTPG